VFIIDYFCFDQFFLHDYLLATLLFLFFAKFFAFFVVESFILGETTLFWGQRLLRRFNEREEMRK
jgi:hypothetical protein